MRQAETIEPGVLNIFRVLAVIELLVSSFQLLRESIRPRIDLLAAWLQIPGVTELYAKHLSWILYLPWLFSAFVLLVYLSSAWLGKKLGGIYLPLAITFQSILLILRLNLLKVSLLSNPLYESDTLLRAWVLFIFLLIPLMLTAWQYSFSIVVLFSFATAALDLVLFLFNAPYLLLSRGTLVGILVLRTSLYLVVGYIISHLVSIQRVQRASLEKANERLARSAAMQEQLSISRERNRLALELHDTLAHTLSALIVQLEAVEVVAGDEQPAVRSRIEQSAEFTRQGLVEVRRAIQNLRASSLEDMGLVLALSSLAEAYAKRNGLTLNLSLPAELPNFRPEIEHSIYRIAEEALVNAARHANATQLSVTLKRENSTAILIVTDNGNGFDPDQPSSPDHFGLQGMRERAQAMGGDLKILSTPGKGTSVLLDVHI
jgi:signal transduction histidine kinase